ncbi:hypothetical protein [Saccharicrinis aurantiacus]|uniref:hypothetical protein n=1 Tax=Saccharicrinis aurantiacus TaxID=1849719 RepID=UPI00083966C1|nr:hypothetical protein [Saccharicrinis aurantiacus]
MKQKRFIFLWLVALSNIAIYSQSTFVNYNYNFTEGKGTLDINLNKTKGSDPKEEYKYFYNKENSPFYIKPSFESHFGSGTKTSENNIQFEAESFIKKKLSFKATEIKGFQQTIQYNIVSPEFSSDKDFVMSQILGKIGFTYYQWMLEKGSIGNVNFILSLNYNYGVNIIENKNEEISRIVISPSLNWDFGWTSPIKNKTNPVFLNKGFYRFSFGANYIHYNFLEQDERVTSNESINYIKINFKFFLIEHLGLNFEYKNGSMSPNFEDIDVTSIGLALKL